MILSVWGFFLWGWFLASVHCGQRKCLIWFQFSWICWGLLCVLSCGLSLKMFHVHLKRMCILLFWDENLYIYISVKSISSRVLLSDTISLLIFCLEDLCIFDSGVLKSPNIIVLRSIAFLKSSKIFLMYLGAPMLGAYIFTMFMSSWWILPLSIRSDLLGLSLWPFFFNIFNFFILYGPSFELYFVWYEYCYPCFFFLSICLENLFPALHFQSVWVFCPEMGLL